MNKPCSPVRVMCMQSQRLLLPHVLERHADLWCGNSGLVMTGCEVRGRYIGRSSAVKPHAHLPLPLCTRNCTRRRVPGLLDPWGRVRDGLLWPVPDSVGSCWVGTWGEAPRCRPPGGSSNPLIPLIPRPPLPIPILSCSAGTKFEHVPVEDIIIGETLAVEQIPEELS